MEEEGGVGGREKKGEEGEEWVEKGTKEKEEGEEWVIFNRGRGSNVFEGRLLK